MTSRRICALMGQRDRDMGTEPLNLPGPPGFERWYEDYDAAMEERGEGPSPLWNGGSAGGGTFVTCSSCDTYDRDGSGNFGADGDVLSECDGCDGMLNWAPKIGWAEYCKIAPVPDGAPPWSAG